MHMYMCGIQCTQLVCVVCACSWRVAFGIWWLAIGGWRMAVGVWRLAVGVWRLAVGLEIVLYIWHVGTAFLGDWMLRCLETRRLGASRGVAGLDVLTCNLSPWAPTTTATTRIQVTGASKMRVL